MSFENNNSSNNNNTSSFGTQGGEQWNTSSGRNPESNFGRNEDDFGAPTTRNEFNDSNLASGGGRGGAYSAQGTGGDFGDDSSRGNYASGGNDFSATSTNNYSNDNDTFGRTSGMASGTGNADSTERYESGGKPKMTARLQGGVEEMAGKVTHNVGLQEKGMERKTGGRSEF